MKTSVTQASLRKLIAFVGLVPGEHSSGPKRRQGTKAGNSSARRMLVEVAWHYQHSARVSPIIATRQNPVAQGRAPTTSKRVANALA